jgi:hypothetical protein
MEVSRDSAAGTEARRACARIEEGVQRDSVWEGDVRERGVGGGEVLALGVEVDERVGDEEAGRRATAWMDAPSERSWR